jgi:rhodanese-related sulfurtransferase
MSKPRRVSPSSAVHLLILGYVFVDVRTPEEYRKGHPTGALNIPYQFFPGMTVKDNPEFLPVIEALFPKDTKLLLIGKIGKRSLLAAEALLAAGYSDVVDVSSGYLGIVDNQGRYIENGWLTMGLPTETETTNGSWVELRERAHLDG